jgi:hypothetical protein
MRLMLATINQLPGYLLDCHSMSDDIQALKEWASLF